MAQELLLTPLQNYVFAEPVKDVRGLEITFPFPDQSHLYASKVCLSLSLTLPLLTPSTAGTISRALPRPRRSGIYPIVLEAPRMGQLAPRGIPEWIGWL